MTRIRAAEAARIRLGVVYSPAVKAGACQAVAGWGAGLGVRSMARVVSRYPIAR